MPPMKKMMNVDRSRLEPVPQTGAAEALPLPPTPAAGPSPFMMCSLPPRAASLDQVARQFYNRTALPQQRILIPDVL